MSPSQLHPRSSITYNRVPIFDTLKENRDCEKFGHREGLLPAKFEKNRSLFAFSQEMEHVYANVENADDESLNSRDLRSREAPEDPVCKEFGRRATRDDYRSRLR